MKDPLAEILASGILTDYRGDVDDTNTNSEYLVVNKTPKEHLDIEYGVDNALSALLLALMKSEPIRDKIDITDLNNIQKDEIKVWFNYHFNY